jgi:hypothetical protein
LFAVVIKEGVKQRSHLLEFSDRGTLSAEVVMAVGFEFQSPTLKIYKLTKTQETTLCALQAQQNWAGLKQAAMAIAATPVFFDKSVVLSNSGTGWCAVPDGDDVEFVVTQVPIMPGGAVQLAQVMQSLRMSVNRIESIFAKNSRRTNCPWVVRSDEPALFNQYPPFLLHWADIQGMTNVVGFPQITGGVTLTKLRKVFKILANNTEAADIFLGPEKQGYVTLLSQITGDFKAKSTQDPKWNHVPSREMRSLVSLIAAYLHRGAVSRGMGLSAVKQLWFIMSRTDFATLFKELPTDERDHYRQNPKDWVDYICKTVMPAVNANYAGGMDADGWLVDRKITDYKELVGDKRVQIEITRRQWLVGMAKGKDELTAKAHPGKKWKDAHGEHRLRGSGALGDKMDEIVLDNLQSVPGAGVLNAPIFEFRAPGVGANLMKHDTWSDYAVKAYRFLAATNVLAKEADIDMDKVFDLG